MKKILHFNKIVLLSALLITSFVICAQKPNNNRRRLNMNKFDKQRKEFVNKKLNLTKEEEAKFWPVFDELQKKAEALNDGFHEKYIQPYKENKIPSNFDYEKAADAIVDAKLQESLLRKEYHQKFKTILSDKKIYLLYVTDKEWFEHLFHEMQKGNLNRPTQK